VWYQPPNDDNSNIDPELLKESVHAPADHPTPQRERSFGNDAAGAVNANAQGPGLASQGSMTPGPQRGPRPSVSSREAIETVRKNASKVPQKRSLADTLMQIQRSVIPTHRKLKYCLFSFSENLAAQKEQNQSRINIELRKQIIDERKQIIDELKLGLWTIKQAQEKIAALEKEDDPRPSKRQKSSREPSPDWDEISSSSD
jgi:molecular chaperone DnaK (HSP70)